MLWNCMSNVEYTLYAELQLFYMIHMRHEIGQVSYLCSVLSKDPGINDDMLLEVVVLCGTFCQDETCASTLVQAGLPQLLVACLKGEISTFSQCIDICMHTHTIRQGRVGLYQLWKANRKSNPVLIMRNECVFINHAYYPSLGCTVSLKLQTDKRMMS